MAGTKPPLAGEGVSSHSSSPAGNDPLVLSMPKMGTVSAQGVLLLFRLEKAFTMNAPLPRPLLNRVLKCHLCICKMPRDKREVCDPAAKNSSRVCSGPLWCTAQRLDPALN